MRGDCEEFDDFCNEYGDEIATSILEDICCEADHRQWPYQLQGMRHDTHDREGNNRTITGTLKFKARAWMFKVQSGNWNGTEVIEWERSTLVPTKAPPPQSVWMLASIDAFMVRMRVEKKLDVLLTMARKSLGKDPISSHVASRGEMKLKWPS